MIRKHENTVSVKAGILAIAVHAILLIGMVLSINWKAAHAPLQVNDVELWDALPSPKVKAPKIEKVEPVKPPPPEPIKKEEPKPAVQEKPIVETPKVDIALENKKKEEKIKREKAEAEKRQKEEEEKRKALADKMREEDLKAQREANLKALQNEVLADDVGQSDKKASAASQGEIDKYRNKIIAKIRGNVNKTLCGGDNPELKVKVDILPTGDIAGEPIMVKRSGNEACDAAVERAILVSQPLPLPTEPVAKAQFRNLVITFKPND